VIPALAVTFIDNTNVYEIVKVIYSADFYGVFSDPQKAPQWVARYLQLNYE